MTTRLTLRMPEVAEQLGVGLSTVQRWVAAGTLPASRVGGVVLIHPADLQALLDGSREGKGVKPKRLRSTA